MTRFVLALAACAVAGLSAPSAFAWGPDGHRIVCAIAWDELNPHARDSVKATIDVQSREQFADSCAWADEYKLAHPDTAAWHMMGVPDDAVTVDLARDCKAPKSCVLGQVIAQDAALDRAGPGSDVALKMLAHLVGDLHEPLNVARASDHNGRDITGHFYGRESNLHAVWETGLLARDGRSWQTIVTDLEDDLEDSDRAAWTATKPIDWANESLTAALSPTSYYGMQFAPFQYGPNYVGVELPVALARLSRAGVRLGAMLNKALSDTPAVSGSSPPGT